MNNQLNKASGVPLYYQLKQWIVDRIEEGRWKAGSMLPSERELSAQFHISRVTVRQALSGLVSEGILTREHGKGTFVAERKIVQGQRLLSFSEDMRTRGMAPGATVIDVCVHYEVPLEIRTILCGEEEGGPILSVERLRLADRQPMCIEKSHLPLNRFPGLETVDLTNKSLYRTLTETYGIRLAKAKQTVEVALPSEREAALLEIGCDVPVFCFKHITYDHQGQPFEYALSVYRGDRYQLHTDVLR
ncbi:GntR family transcriptional regulator [Numidum massiliense]|uniref:GntR family transcriptional regulator n=1 Tax=Numidum massiliense TaxID=1522315 RepID=UPI0006D57BBB|nr:GntR family transcriptional regulator [Numidum massiliense]